MYNSPYQSHQPLHKKIELIYLLDILFLLLILFMIYSINARPNNSITLDLPDSKSGVFHSKKHTTITIDQKSILINNTPCNFSISDCLIERKVLPKDLLILNASKDISLQKFIHIMDNLKSKNYKNIELEVDKL